MRNRKSRHSLALLLAITVVALASSFLRTSLGPKTEALDVFLETIPGPVVLGETNSRSLVFFNAALHPHLLTDFANERGLPEDLMARIFELPEDVPVPQGLTNADTIRVEQLLELESTETTLMAITPIAMNEDQSEVLFGAVYMPSERTDIPIVVVWMKHREGAWVVHKVARMA